MPRTRTGNRPVNWTCCRDPSRSRSGNITGYACRWLPFSPFRLTGHRPAPFRMIKTSILDLMPVGMRWWPCPKGLVAPSLAHQGRIAALQGFIETPTRAQIIEAATGIADIAARYPCHRAAVHVPAFMAEPLRAALWERNIIAVVPLTTGGQFIAWVPLIGGNVTVESAVSRILRRLDGQSVKSIAKEDGTSVQSVYRTLRKHGLGRAQQTTGDPAWARRQASHRASICLPLRR